MSWPLGAYGLLGLALAAGLGWYERGRPDARIVALVGTLAAFAALGRIAFAAVPNVKPTSDIVLVAGFALGAGPGFAVGAIAGLTSNFFFGQGPWTPWQMAAWGATGVLGAVLARACRARGGRDAEPGGEPPRIGRWPLALVCGAAGFAFTAVQDAGDWVTYSNHSLPALGAYIGQGLGFDAVYAGASLGFALAFGPALVRSIQRFARRIEVTWAAAPDVIERIVPALVIAAVGGAALLGPAAPRARAAGTSGASGAAQRAARYLERAQNPNGGLGAAPGEPSAELFAGWAALGLSSAGIDVATLRRGPGDATLLAYLRRGAQTRDVGSLERTILALRAAGSLGGAGTPGHFTVDGRDLVAALDRRFSARGSVAGQVNLTAFGLLALRAAAARSTLVLQLRARRWLAGQSDRDGGYGFEGHGSQSDADDTGAVLEALAGGSGADVVRARRRAVAYLRRDEDRDGGFPNQPGEGSDAQSTAWAIQGLIAAGVAPGSLRRDGHSPAGYLRSLVTATGAVRYARGQTETPVWVTGEALMALTGTPLPVAPPGRVPRSAARRSASASTTTAGATATTSATTTATTTRSAVPTTSTPSASTPSASPSTTTPSTTTPARRARTGHRSPVAPRPAAAAAARAITRMVSTIGALPALVLRRVGLGA